MYKDNGEGTLLVRRGTREEIKELEKRYKKALNEVLKSDKELRKSLDNDFNETFK